MMSVRCVRNTIIEDYHAGIVPHSKTGDFSDVKVVTPFGEIPWNEVSRISDKEMEAFKIEVVDKIYTYLQHLLNPHFTEQEKEHFMEYSCDLYPTNWNEPKLNKHSLSEENRSDKRFKEM